MKVSGSVTLEAVPERVWQIINDPKAMRDCMPGCAGLESKGPDHYEAQLEVGYGGASTAFDAELRVSEKQPPRGYRLSVRARGTAGDVEGSGTVTLAPEANRTHLRYDAEIQVTGLMALAGAWLLAAAADELAAQFFSRLARWAGDGGESAALV